MRALIAATLLLFAGCFQFSRAQQTVAPQATFLPDNVLNAEIKSARGPSFRLSDFAGKVLIINFWATWVGPSRMEAPFLVDLQKHYWSRGVRVVGLNTENVADSRAQVRRWLNMFHPQYKIGWAAGPVLTLLEIDPGKGLLPQTYVLSPTGRVVRRLIGFNPDKRETELKAAIEEALKDKRETPVP